MFNLEYVAANVGSQITRGSDVFKTEALKADDTGKITLAYAPVPVVSGGQPKLFYRIASEAGDKMSSMVVTGREVDMGATAAGQEFCVLYRYTDDNAQEIVVNAQFIPDTLHAVLTVALYSGDSCNVEAATKAGEVEIDIPRFQLSGAMDISMSAVRLVSL